MSLSFIIDAVMMNFCGVGRKLKNVFWDDLSKRNHLILQEAPGKRRNKRRH
jgi:hypothetical protein